MKIKKVIFGFTSLILLTVLLSLSSPVFAFSMDVPSDGLQLKASGTMTGQALTMHGKYTLSSGNTYHGRVDFTGYLTGYTAWDVVSTTRVISNPTSNVGLLLITGSHDMLFILASGVSLGNMIPITSNGFGDWSFQVISQETITTAGAGTTCWRLQHAASGSIMWYDAASGINLKGILNFGGGNVMEWTVTEIITPTDPGIPGFELLFVVVGISIAFLTILTWNKRRKYPQ